MKTIKKVHLNYPAVIGLFSYAIIKITAFVCATIIMLRLYWWLGAILFLLALLVRFEFHYDPEMGGPTPAVPDGQEGEAKSDDLPATPPVS